ncbi:MAG: hypothetical protein COA79_24965 [Planctomycetota bacterium]|nr:MAG: hypothetical protein COA79_24965 [Planctomycetota bacterium]
MIEEGKILEAIKNHFELNQEHVCKIIASNYSLNWLKTECQVAINWSKKKCLGQDEYVHISNISSNEGNEDHADILITNKEKKILAKVDFDLYDPNNPLKSLASIKAFKRRLDSQIQVRQKCKNHYPIIGILFAIWKVKLPTDNSLNQETAFYVDLTNELKKYFHGTKFSSIHSFRPDSIILNQEVDWGVDQWETSLLATSILCPDTFIEEEFDESEATWIDELAEDEPASFQTQEIDAAQRELNYAKNVQQNMLKEAPETPGYQFSTRYEGADEVSGDFYEFIKLPDGKIGFAQGDVSGHGVQAGLVMSMAKKVLSMNARRGQSPAQVLSSVNEELIQDLNGKTFVSMSYGILDTYGKKLVWARAGHNPSILYNIHTNEIQSLKPPGMVAGLRDTFLFRNIIKEDEIKLNSGDIFMFYTDGLTETANRQGEPYRQDRLEDVIRAHGKLDLDHLLGRIMDGARSFRGGANPADDITLVALKVD